MMNRAEGFGSKFVNLLRCRNAGKCRSRRKILLGFCLGKNQRNWRIVGGSEWIGERMGSISWWLKAG